MGLTWQYLYRDVFGQFIPLYRLGFLVYWHIFGVHFWPFRLCSIMCSWTIILIFWFVGERWRLRREATAIVCFVIAVDPVFVTNYQWASAALSVDGSTIPSLLALAVAANSLLLNWNERVGIAALFTVGLLLYPKTLFLILLIVSVRAFVFTQAKSTTSETIRVIALDALPTSFVAVVYLVVVEYGGYTSGVARPSLTILLEFIRRGWSHGALVATLGLDAASKLQLTVANVFIAVIVVFSVVRNWKTAILWVGFAAYFITCIGIIGWNRAVPFGLESAETAHYYADIFCYAIIVGLLAYASFPRNAQSRPSSKYWLVSSVASVFAAVYFLRASALVPHLWYAGPEKPAQFVANVRSSLKKLGSTDTIADATVPTDVMPSWMFPYNQYDKFLPMLGVYDRVVPALKATYAFDSDGSLIRRLSSH
jgi:hypothetical protein